MTDSPIDLESARAAARDHRWREAYELLGQGDPADLAPEDLEVFADAAWWSCRVDEEIALRQRAFTGFVAAGHPRRAAYAAWLLSVRHGLRGEAAVSSGWLQRAHRHLGDEPDCVEQGYVACSEVEQALGEGRVEDADRHADRAVAIGERFGAPELIAFGMAWQGQCRLVRDELDEGLQLLDEAMASVAAGELDAHFTGWISCFAIGMCMGVADLHRASTWAQAAWDWASGLPQPTPYLGLCRVRQVEVMGLRGELEHATAEGQRACEEMLEFEPHLAGDAFSVTGEILRRRGQTQAAERAFTEARDLGHDPQPGLARLRLSQGQAEAAAASLRTALTAGGRPALQRASLLAAQVEVAVIEGDLDLARAACDELVALAQQVQAQVIDALSATARGRVRLAKGDAAEALAVLRPAAATWRALGIRYEAAETRALVGLALRALGDAEGADFELEAARGSFERLGASRDATRVAGLMAAPPRLPGGLTERECEVLQLTAAGLTNRQIASELVLSEHTVSRHLSNIFTKIGVSSRTAAAAFAFEHDLA